ncbi:hypothetical protein, variant [Blastomyces dermatitidis ER-3]|uniref:HNH nuclease domain-containing protein n=2 Tax=Blastomyces TaxID=229219 RepID=A0A179UIK6_BLAGS|nr:hypothetical protein, variant [Blastomyces gilchristii SLH14081]XP_031577521.1 uncharacterized protein BDBG_03090 [Blastomyces gilchristii SLH14081]XP_045272169.1 uncharacterized protein BDCG_00931 [Blastomyces dermatitidis ER-3]XP_045279364.1 hypothetical protein, variant [Blastomyces dermatitidis ER-3]EEQ84126.1 hypothetical protein BDCG_00931 [Blastomyces dermatitidis ER-3]OAS99636.1 hypothetical protein, variant [Blastomyces dermatitidis ER-3]OAT06967.1 hypothetical protein BDBG_03090 
MANGSLSEFHPHPIPHAELALRGSINFLHPGYQEPRNVLLYLPRVDQEAGPHTFGVHHQTALIACQIIGNNAFKTGRLCHDKDGRQPVNVPLDGVLTDPTYYFLVDAGASKYPIVPSFQDWEFPHDCIPDAWGPPSVFPEPRISRCGITNFSTCTEEAHLVPKEELLWYYRNGMSQYCTNLGDIDDSANLVSLRPDIHKCFDNRWFVIVPKVAGGRDAPEVVTGTRSAHYVSHILSTAAAEYWPTYHNTIVQYLDSKSRPYLFARFAWAILLFVKPFVTAGDSRHVVRLQASTGVEDVELEWKAEFLSGAQLRASYSGGGLKSATSKKGRSALDALGEDNDLAESSEDSDIGMENDIWDNVMDEWEARGYSRRQQISSETAPETAPEIISADATGRTNLKSDPSGLQVAESKYI